MRVCAHAQALVFDSALQVLHADAVGVHPPASEARNQLVAEPVAEGRPSSPLHLRAHAVEEPLACHLTACLFRGNCKSNKTCKPLGAPAKRRFSDVILVSQRPPGTTYIPPDPDGPPQSTRAPRRKRRHTPRREGCRWRRRSSAEGGRVAGRRGNLRASPPGSRATSRRGGPSSCRLVSLTRGCYLARRTHGMSRVRFELLTGVMQMYFMQHQ